MKEQLGLHPVMESTHDRPGGATEGVRRGARRADYYGHGQVRRRPLYLHAALRPTAAVEVVIADTAIRRVHEAQACARFLQQRGPDVTVTDSTVLRQTTDMDRRCPRHLGLQQPAASPPGRRAPVADRHPPSASTASTCRMRMTPDWRRAHPPAGLRDRRPAVAQMKSEAYCPWARR